MSSSEREYTICETCGVRRLVPLRRGRPRSIGRAYVAVELAGLLAGGRRLTTRELVAALGRRQVAIPGKHPVNNVSMMLSRDPRFTLDRGAWRLADAAAE